MLLIGLVAIFYHLILINCSEARGTTYDESMYEILDVKIPWPSGIAIDSVRGDGNTTLRFGRLQHNIIELRPRWSGIHLEEKLFSKKECKKIINRTEEFAALHGWTTGRHIDYLIRPTSDLPVNVVFHGDEFSNITKRIQSRIFPKFSESFNLDITKLRISDLFITKYDASIDDRRRLGPHKDKSPWSFVVVLNSKFEGGGTYFFQTQELWRPPIGAALYFSGVKLHGGSPITTGIRYILAGFCDYGGDDHESFMELYDPVYDGFAARAGFRTGDLIVGLEVCEQQDGSNVANLNSETECTQNNIGVCSNPSRVVRQMVTVDDRLSDEAWKSAAQSCEILQPQSESVLRVRRRLHQ